MPVSQLPTKLSRSANPAADSRRRFRWVDLAAAAALGTFSFAIYNATLTPSLSYLSPDGNELATVPYILGLAHSTGYPLYTWLGKLFTFLPVGDVAHRINLMSAILGAGGVALLYGIVLIVLEPEDAPERHSPARRVWFRLVAAATALVFAFSPSFWSQTSISEVYAPNLFMVGVQMILLLKWARVELRQPAGPGLAPSAQSLGWFGSFCLAFALSTGTHFSNLGFGLGYAVFVLAVNWRFAFNWRALGLGIGLFTLGMLQHLWLPYKASSLIDPLMQRNNPSTWSGFYAYTLGAFSNMKFAFTWSQAPDRIVIYLDLLLQQFGLPGILLGIGGMWTLALKHTRQWWLLGLMYVVHLVFFTQYAVFDLDVFFIPSHFLFAIFIATGIEQVGVFIRAVVRSLLPRLTQPRLAGWASVIVGAVALGGWPVGQISAHWEESDHSSDVAINDFYENVWEVLPEGAAILGQNGVFGYDLFYWRLVYNTRQDVLIPGLPDTPVNRSELNGRLVFSTVAGGASTGPLPDGSFTGASQSWAIPVLVGNSPGATSLPNPGRSDLALYFLSSTPPDLFADPREVNPTVTLDAQMGGTTLIGIDLEPVHAWPGGRLEVALYWETGEIQIPRITLALGDTVLESHQLGFGNLSRATAALEPEPGSIVVEQYQVVIPSTMAAGDYPVVISIGDTSVVIDTITLTAGAEE
jgi:hypothetical protein